MPHADFLQLVLSDEVARREAGSIALRARTAGLGPPARPPPPPHSHAPRRQVVQAPHRGPPRQHPGLRIPPADHRRAAHHRRFRAPAPHPGPFFFNDTATTEIYTLSLHDALPI